VGANTVIAAYRARTGCEDRLLALLRSHYPVLRRLGLVTEQAAILLKSAHEQVYVEIFEWSSQEAIGIAHQSAEVNALWAELNEIGDYISLASLKECSKPFAKFAHVTTNQEKADRRAA
jgi:hypothetical protein